MRDLVSAERRELPWVKVEKKYVFDTPEGKKTLAELFGRNSQLIIQHFMWRRDSSRAAPAARSRPTTPKARSCIWRTTTCLLRSRARRSPSSRPTSKRMGWTGRVGFVLGSDFNYDYHVSFTRGGARERRGLLQLSNDQGRLRRAPGLSVFYKDEGATSSIPIRAMGAATKR